MRRVACEPRPDWPRRVEVKGLVFHTTEQGTPYWDESACYEFERREVDVIEEATQALDRLCLHAIEHVMTSPRWEEFGVPPGFIPWVRKSWEEDEHTVYGRFDLLYDGREPPKLCEYNADT